MLHLLFNRLLACKTCFPILYCFLLAACAQVVSPTGGKRDNQPPVVLGAVPASGVVNFGAKSVTIKFNEYFTVKNPAKEWLISPPLKQVPDYKIAGKKLEISFMDTLLANTTYCINFGSSIADLNEGNVLNGFSYIFSTGSLLDSLSLKGTIKNALSLLPEKNVLVMLYDIRQNGDDSCVYKVLPKYCTITDTRGAYTLEHLAAGQYRIVALKDLNANYLFDSGDELIGFADSSIYLPAQTKQDLKVFRTAEQKNYVKNKYSNCKGCYTIMMNAESDSIDVVPANNTTFKSILIKDKSVFGDTLNIWLSDLSVDTLEVFVNDHGKMIDTLSFETNPKLKAGSRAKTATHQTQVKLLPENNKEKEYLQLVSISLNRPVTKVNTDSMKLVMGEQQIPFKLLENDKLHLKYLLDAQLKADSSYTITMFPGAFRDCLGYTNDTVVSRFKNPSAEQFGNLYLMVQCDTLKKMFPAKDWLFELLNEKGQVVLKQKIKDTQIIELLHYRPGKYSVRIVIDQNKNGRWDTGNYLKKIQPEPILYRSALFNMRANWDLEEEWIPGNE